MIAINLLPSGRPIHAIPTWWKQLPWKKIAGATGGALAVWSLWVLTAAQSQTRSLARLRAEWEALSPERVQLEQQQALLQALRNREAILKNLKAPEGRWAPRLNFISDVLVSDLWFTLLSFSTGSKNELTESQELQDLQLPGLEIPGAPGASGESVGQGLSLEAPHLILAGAALVGGKGDGPPVTRFLQKLKEHPEFSRWFSGVDLKGIRHRQVKSEEVSDFVIFLFPTTGR